MVIVASKGKLDFAVTKNISCKEKIVTFHDSSFYKSNFTNAPTADVDVDVIVATQGNQINGLKLLNSMKHICICGLSIAFHRTWVTI